MMKIKRPMYIHDEGIDGSYHETIFCIPFKKSFKIPKSGRVPLVEQELPTFLEHLSSSLVFSGVRVTRSLVLYVCFVDHCLSFFLWPLCCLSYFD
jgi:hypothetical protein